MSSRAANAYQRVHLESASPARILDEVLVKAVRRVHEARELIQAGDVAGKARAVGQALELVVMLAGALDRTAAPELCVNLAGLYAFGQRSLIEASARMDTAPLDEVERILTTLQAAFREAAVAA